MKSIEKQHKLALIIVLVFVLLISGVWLNVAFSQEQLSPEIQAIQKEAGRIQGELRHLGAIVTMHQERMNGLNTEIKQLQDKYDVLVRQQQMDKMRAEAEKTKTPEKK